ncbi:MAG: hypothetical protein D6696_17930 [Acidobacteria bacterium]|nr:MAG: hypothetical protein D6696_17930 [Acidobacteriota bacterium]
MSRLAPWAGTLRYLVDRRGRAAAERAIDRALPGLGAAERRAIGRASYRQQAAMARHRRFVEQAPERAICRRLEHRGWHHLHAAAAGGRGVVLLTAAAGCPALALRAMAIYRPRLVLADERSDVAALRPALDDGGDVALRLDLSPAGSGEPLPFLGREARPSPLAARLAIAAGAPLVPVFALPTPRPGIFCLRLCQGLEPPAAGDPEATKSLLVRCLGTIEEVIRAQPACWPWGRCG